MELISIDQDLKCFHCGDECDARPVHFENKSFCCSGCKSIYEILKMMLINALETAQKCK